jgi:hypothetical protein
LYLRAYYHIITGWNGNNAKRRSEMKQADIKKGNYYANERATRFVLDIEDGFGPYPPRVKYLSLGSSDPTFPRWCDLKTLAKWAKRMVAPVFVYAQPCPDCRGWCNVADYPEELCTDLECPECGHFHEARIYPTILR